MARERPRKLDAAELQAYALRVLGLRAQATEELRIKLRRKAARLADVEDVIARLRGYGYLDDSQFAAGFASARLENEGHGRARVMRDLRQRHVSSAVAEKAVQEAFHDTDETALIERYLERKFRKVPLRDHLADPKRLAAAFRRLRNAGFSGPASIQVLRRYAHEADWLETADEPDPQT